MSFLLTPVALICPLFCNPIAGVAADSSAAINAEVSQMSHQQVVCRIGQEESGATTVHVGTNAIEIFPIHYVDGGNAHVIFAARLLGAYVPKHTHMWTGDIHQQRRSSTQEEASFIGNELSLISLQLSSDLDWQSDHLCISFETEHGTREMAQIQLRRA